MSRITMNNVAALLIKVCEESGNPYIVEGASGGYRLTDAQGSRDILNTGYVSKSVLYDCMWSFLQGIRVGKEVVDANL